MKIKNEIVSLYHEALVVAGEQIAKLQAKVNTGSRFSEEEVQEPKLRRPVGRTAIDLDPTIPTGEEEVQEPKLRRPVGAVVSTETVAESAATVEKQPSRARRAAKLKRAMAIVIALIVIVVLRLYGYIPYLLIGVVSLLQYRGFKRDWSRDDETVKLSNLFLKSLLWFELLLLNFSSTAKLMSLGVWLPLVLLLVAVLLAAQAMLLKVLISNLLLITLIIVVALIIFALPLGGLQRLIQLGQGIFAVPITQQP